MTEAALLVWLAERPALVRQFRSELETLQTSTPENHELRDLLLLKNTLGALNPDEAREIEGILSRLKQEREAAEQIETPAASTAAEAFCAASTVFRLRVDQL